MRVYFIGIGMDGDKTLTYRAKEAIEEADVLIGAKRMIESVNVSGKPLFEEYKPQKIAEIIDNSAYNTAAVLLSGDISFYSGAKKAKEYLSNHEIISIPGISSFSYMCGKIGVAIEDTEIVSFHKNKSDPYSRPNICCRVRDNKYVFVLMSGMDDIDHIIMQLECYGLDNCIIYVGSRLGYDNEKITSCKVSENFDYSDIDDLAVMLIENPNPKKLIGKYPKDDEFIRSKVPMTKEEVRAISLAKLNLGCNSVLYDIGSGTGSIAVAAAMTSHEIRIFAFEKDDDAFAQTNLNRLKFGCDNIWQIKADAPYCIDVPPVPTHAFIGGSGGKMKEIVAGLFKRNHDIKIVVNAIALNTIAEVMNLINEMNLQSDIVSINTAHSKRVGNYDMMMGQNPVYVFTLTTKNDDKE